MLTILNDVVMAQDAFAKEYDGTDTGVIGDGVAVAQVWIAYADKARAVRCSGAAKGTLLDMIDTYTGTAYASPRLHVQVEIDDMRAAPQALDPAYCADLGPK